MNVEGKGKVHPRPGHKGPGGMYRHGSTLSLTLAIERSGWSTTYPDSRSARNEPVPTVHEARWASGLVWKGALNLTPLGFDPQIIQPVVSRYIDCAILALISRNVHVINLKRS